MCVQRLTCSEVKKPMVCVGTQGGSAHRGGGYLEPQCNMLRMDCSTLPSLPDTVRLTTSDSLFLAEDCNSSSLLQNPELHISPFRASFDFRDILVEQLPRQTDTPVGNGPYCTVSLPAVSQLRALPSRHEGTPTLTIVSGMKGLW
jgi:hypothetical protein